MIAAVFTVALTITVFPGGSGGESYRYTLRCGPVGGTLPQATLACRRLLARPSWYAPTPGDRVCTQIYGGPQEAVVRGTYRDRKIWVRFTRRDGCAIERWNAVRFLFVAP